MAGRRTTHECWFHSYLHGVVPSKDCLPACSVATAGSTQAERLIAFVGCGHWAMDRKAFYPSVRSRDLVRIPEQKQNLQSRRMTLESGCAGHCDCYDIRMS